MSDSRKSRSTPTPSGHDVGDKRSDRDSSHSKSGPGELLDYDEPTSDHEEDEDEDDPDEPRGSHSRKRKRDDDGPEDDDEDEEHDSSDHDNGSDKEGSDSTSHDESSDSSPPRKRSKSRDKSSGPHVPKGMFDPFAAKRAEEVHLSTSQAVFVTQFFSKPIDHTFIKDFVLKEHPIPVHPAIVVPETDDPVLNLVDHRKRDDVKRVDHSLTRVNKKIVNIMGPLGSVWKKIHKARKQRTGTFDIDQLADSMEKAITVVGQALTSVIYQRQLNIVTGITGSTKQSVELMKKQSDSLETGPKLFGSDFKKSLYKTAKSMKEGQIIKDQLGHKSSFKSRRPFSGSAPRGRDNRGGRAYSSSGRSNFNNGGRNNSGFRFNSGGGRGFRGRGRASSTPLPGPSSRR